MTPFFAKLFTLLFFIKMASSRRHCPNIDKWSPPSSPSSSFSLEEWRKINITITSRKAMAKGARASKIIAPPGLALNKRRFAPRFPVGRARVRPLKSPSSSRKALSLCGSLGLWRRLHGLVIYETWFGERVLSTTYVIQRLYRTVFREKKRKKIPSGKKSYLLCGLALNKGSQSYWEGRTHPGP